MSISPPRGLTTGVEPGRYSVPTLLCVYECTGAVTGLNGVFDRGLVLSFKFNAIGCSELSVQQTPTLSIYLQ